MLLSSKIPGDHFTNPLKARLLAPFSAKYRNRLDLLAQSPAWQVAHNYSVLTEDRKMLFIKTPKAGSTSTIQHILRRHHGSFVANTKGLKTPVLRGKDHWRAYLTVHDDPACFKFSIVRDPEARLLSCYANLFVDATNRVSRKHLRLITRRGYRQGGDLSRNFDVFLDYVAEAHAQSLFYCDGHWRPQHICIGHGLIRHDFIGRMESYEADLRHAFAAAGYPDPLAGQETRRAFNKSSRRSFELTRAQKTRIRQLFEQDFQLFGYE
jgi:hypothetical protein